MTAADFQALAPLLALPATAIAVLVAIAARRHHGVTFALTLAGLSTAISLAAAAWNAAPRPIGELLVVDRFAHFYLILIACGAGATALLSYGYLQGAAGAGPAPAAGHADASFLFSGRRKEEFYVLLLLATTGAAVLAAAAHFASFFLGLELLTVPLYAMIAYRRRLIECIESGVKYLVLAGAASAVLLFGMALVYAQTGKMTIAGAFAGASLAHGATGPAEYLAAAGVAMILAAVGFKLALVPFHLWAADVYEGAPAPVSGFLATVSKGAVFAVLLRHFAGGRLPAGELAWGALAVIAGASMLAGNLLALRQQNLKRILAYSSIAHMGYLLTAFLAGRSEAGLAVTFYLAAYFVTSLGAFGVLSALSGPGRDAGRLEGLRGLAWRRPALGGVLTVMLLSLAGIPLTAGFMGKLIVLGAGVGAGLWALAALLVVGSVIGAYYYLRVIVVLFRTGGEESAGAATITGATGGHPAAHPLPPATSLALAAMTLLVLGLGMYPGPVITLIRRLF